MQHFERDFRGCGELRLYFQGWRPNGEPKGVLPIVHGFGEHSGRYENVVKYLVRSGYAMYSFDLRGHGRSPGQRGHINDWVELRQDVHEFVRVVSQREPGRPIFLFGHSLGGLIVLEYVLHYPEGLHGVIVSGAALSQTGLSPVLFTLSRIMSRVWPTFSIDTKLDVSTISSDQAVVQAYRDDPLVHSLGTARLGTEVVAAQQWTQEHAAEFSVPLLMVHGCEDRLIPLAGGREFYEHVTLADKELTEYEGAYHEVHNDFCRARELSELEHWLERHLK
jgi:alpha-beta hydrolase superfamily lysophospholipase